jgi:hypothetical protein
MPGLAFQKPACEISSNLLRDVALCEGPKEHVQVRRHVTLGESPRLPSVPGPPGEGNVDTMPFNSDTSFQNRPCPADFDSIWRFAVAVHALSNRVTVTVGTIAMDST